MMAQSISIAVKVKVTVEPDKEAGVFVSHCPVLRMFSQGDTEDEAKEAIEEAIGLHLKTAFRFGRLHQLLIRAGFDHMRGGMTASDLEACDQYVSVEHHSDDQKEFEIEVPLTLVAAAAAKSNQWQPSL
jgi:predicted RNase H-like HicB family nuclease